MDSPTLVTSVESRVTLLLPVATFGVKAMARLANAVPSLTGPKYAYIAAAQHILVMLVLRLFRPSAIKVLPQVQRSPPPPPSAVPKPPRSNLPPNTNAPPPRRPPRHQPPQPRPRTFRGQELLKGTLVPQHMRSVAPPPPSPARLRLTAPLRDQILATLNTPLTQPQEVWGAAGNYPKYVLDELPQSFSPLPQRRVTSVPLLT